MKATIVRVVISAWNDLRAKKTRAFAALLGMVIAIVAVIVLDAATELSRAANEEFVARQYGRPATVALQGTRQMQEQGPPTSLRNQNTDMQDRDTSDRIAFAEQQKNLLEENGVSAVSFSGSTQGTLFFNEQRMSAEMNAVSPTWNQTFVVDIVAGSWPQQEAVGLMPRAVVSPGVVSTLGITPEMAIGYVIYYAESTTDPDAADLHNLTLRPVVIDGVARWSANSSSAQVLLISNVPDTLGLSLQQVRVFASVPPVDIPFVEGLYMRWASTGPWRVSEAGIQRIDQFSELGPILRQQEVTASVVTVVALATAGCGILGVGLASIRERSRDFGIRIALGATPADIFWSVLFQSVLESIVAALIAVPIAAGVILAFPRQLVVAELPVPDITLIPVSSLALGVGAAIVVGALAGVLPAIRASRLSVIRAVRS